MEKKEITARTTIKAIITGFVSYGIIIIFISLLLFTICNYALKNFSASNAAGLYITLPLMADIIIYLVLQGVCHISTFDVFKKCKTNPENYKTINKFMDIFYIACIFVSIIVFLSLLHLNLQYQLKSIEYAELQYKGIFSEQHIELLKNEMYSTFSQSRTNLTRSTVILVIGIALSFLSLIPHQRKMITKYNEF